MTYFWTCPFPNANLDPALGKLEEMGYIRTTEVYTGKRPSVKILVNPATISAKSAI